MQEGTLSPNADRVPNISLDESLKMEKEMQRLMLQVPGCRAVLSLVWAAASLLPILLDRMKPTCSLH